MVFTFLENAYIRQLHDAFHSEGLRGFLSKYEALRHESAGFRYISTVLEVLLPVRHICNEIFKCDEVIGLDPAHGDKLMLEDWGITIDYKLGDNVLKILQQEPFLAYGNHTAMFEYFSFSALVGRYDCYHIAASYFEKLGPKSSRRCLLVQNVATSKSEKNRIGGLEALKAVLEAFLWPKTDDPSARIHNLQVLDHAAELIGMYHACVNIFPTGSPRQDAEWKNGLGSLVRRLCRYNSNHSIYLIPIVYKMGISHLLASRILPIFCPTRFLALINVYLFLGKPTFYAPKAIPLDSLPISEKDSDREITRRLREIWLDIQAANTRL